MRSVLLLVALTACSEPRSDHGTLLLATGTQWVVQHDDPLSRMVQGTEIYASTDTTTTVGSHVDLWVDRDSDGFGTVRRSSVTGSDPVAPNHIDGGAPVVGTVIRTEPSKLLVDHEPIPDVMPGMVMPFIVGRADTTRLTPGDLSPLEWLPSSCAYKRVHEGRGLESWHPLVSGDPLSIHDSGVSITGYAISSLDLSGDEDPSDYILGDASEL